MYNNKEPIIANTDTLASFCNELSKASFVAVDTEFMREKTYWPQLCLVQLAGEDKAVAVDALSENIDLTPLIELMADKGVTKVFHAARQDFEIFYNLAKKLPSPVFDTQIAAMVCGFGESVGYDTLVNKLTGNHVDKSLRFTDWSMRPLTKKQVAYALGDVTHLRQIYEALKKQLDESERYEWLNEEMAKLMDINVYETPPHEAWRRIKTRNGKPRFLAILREVSAWRELEARRKNVPRNRILRDETIVDIANQAPSSLQDLLRLRRLNQKIFKGPNGQKILEAIEKGNNLPEKECPQLPHRTNIRRNLAPVIELLKVLLKMKSEKHNVAQKLIANNDDLEKISAYGEKSCVPAIHGWRLKIFGQDALNLRDGKLALIINEETVELVNVNTGSKI